MAATGNISPNQTTSGRSIPPQRGHRGGKYPFVRGALCVIVRELILYSVLQDMMAGRPIMYATFSSWFATAPRWPRRTHPGVVSR